MKVKFVTLGCKVNQYESEAMLEQLLSGGFQKADEKEPADVVVVNSCTVTAVSYTHLPSLSCCLSKDSFRAA